MVYIVKTARVLRGAASILGVAFLLTCGSDSGTGPEKKNDEPTLIAISLSSTSAVPMDEIDIAGVPNNLDIGPVYATVEAVGSDAVSDAFVSRRQDGTVYMLAPLKPAEFDIADGGDVDITLDGGGIVSNTVRLTIEPLPPATTTIQNLVDLMQQHMTVWLVAHGTTRQELRETNIEDLPIQYFPLWVAHHVLDSPDNPNSVRALVDGPIPFFDNEVMDFDITNRLISRTDFAGFYNEEIASIDSLNMANESNASYNPRRAKGDSRPQTSSTACITGGAYGIQDAATLDAAMWKARFAMNRLDGASGEAVSGIARVVSELGRIPVLKGGATAVGAGVYIYNSINEAVSKVLPSSFDNRRSRFYINGDKVVYNEDDTGGFWEQFEVTAVSQGWKMDEFIIEAILELAGIADEDGTVNITAGLEGYAKDLTKYVVSTGVSAATEVIAGEGFVEICPGTWPDIDVSSPLYSKAEIPLGTSFEFVDHTFFETREIGVSEIRVGTISGQNMFGGAPPAIAPQQRIEVIGIEVEVSPSEVSMFKDDVQIFDAVVRNASDDKVKWTLPNGFTQVALENFGKTITIESPSSGWNTPVSLRARSQANTGSREDKVDSDPRDGFALITPIGDGTITVSPSGICVKPNGRQEFRATVTGLTDPAVTWSASAGTFSGNMYTAPPTEVAEVTITATSVENPTVQGFATVEVADCTCSWSLLVSGEASGSYEGIKAIWQTGLYSAVNLAVDESDTYPAISIVSLESFTVPGTYEVITEMVFSPGLIYGGVDDPDFGLAPPTLVIWSIDGTEMIGSLNGKLARPIAGPPFSYGIVDVSINFRAQNLNQADPCNIP